MRKSDPATLFWSKVDRSGECWLWLAAKDRDGYGKFAVTLSRDGVPTGAKTPQRHLRAHHFAWELNNPRVPAGMILMHSCDTPACVNPKHLSIGTPRDNYADAQAKGRNTRGERNSRSKLTASIVRAIRASNDGPSVLATRFGVTVGAIHAIRSGRTWRHVADESVRDSLAEAS